MIRHNWTWEEILILVKAYPTVSRKYIEASCTAGITRDSEWLRLYPIPYRGLKQDKRFKKFQWIKARIKKATNDYRPESHNIDINSIEIMGEVPPTNNWALRKALLSPLLTSTVEELWQLRKETDKSLGFIRPKKIRRLEIRPAERSEWTEEEKVILMQTDFFDEDAPRRPLEKIPYDFSYRFLCENPACKGHVMKIVDWEMCELYRKCRRTYGADWETPLREKYERQMIEKFETCFFVGTMKGHLSPKSWIIVGLFYPQRSDAEQLVLDL
jgi:hypothetical protein